MLDQLLINMGVQFKFYRRNRLLLVMSLLFLSLVTLSLIPTFYRISSMQHFEVLSGIFNQLNGFALVFTAGLGLFSVSSHLKNRNVKMVLTKPCLPEVWLGSVFASAVVVSFSLFLAVFLLTLILSLYWGIPFQPGFAYLSLHSFSHAVVFLSYLTFLAMLMHPFMAVLVALLLNDGTFYSLKFMVMVLADAFGSSAVLTVLQKCFYAVYMVLPMTQPISENIYKIKASMRVTTGDWLDLLNTLVYMFAITGLFYYLSDWSLRRKKLM